MKNTLTIYPALIDKTKTDTMDILKNVIQNNRQDIKDVSAGKKMFCSQAFEKFKYQICDLLSVPPDVCLTEAQWQEIIVRNKKLFNR